ncbi:MAG: retropepsin-like aspartic protease [Sandarakinorhabdus sp.]|jgi:hypothetical protein
MPVVEGRHNGRQILTEIFVAPLFNPAHPTFESGVALIDTGATASLISQSIARRLQLPPRAKRQMITARGSEMVTQYRFRLGFPSNLDVALPYLLDAEFIGSELNAQTKFDVIVGMDVLSMCDFQMSSNYNWRLQF